jgi:hypothetical protein
MSLNAFLNQYKSLLPWNLARLKCFMQMILGLIASSSVQQHQCALGFEGTATQESICRRIRNFLGTFSFDCQDIARALVALCSLQGPLHLVLDRTNWKFGGLEINLLVLAVVVSKRFSIPLFWKALPKSGTSNAVERVDVIRMFMDTFGVASIASLIADREFIGKAWVDFLMLHRIPFVIRIKGNRLVEWGRIQRHIKVFFNHLKVGERRHLEKRLDGHCLYFAGTRSKEGEIVIVMSNQPWGIRSLDIYKKRWTIESLFKHCKTNGFNMEDTHLKDLRRLEKLFAVVVSALTLVFLAGRNAESARPTPYKHSVKAPAFSTFRRGFDLLRKLVIQAKNEALTLLSRFLPPPASPSKSCLLHKIVR